MDRQTLDRIILLRAHKDESLAECLEEILGAEILIASRGEKRGDLEPPLESFELKALDKRENINFFIARFGMLENRQRRV